jgi:hypothetical protein
MIARKSFGCRRLATLVNRKSKGSGLIKRRTWESAMMEPKIQAPVTALELGDMVRFPAMARKELKKTVGTPISP